MTDVSRNGQHGPRRELTLVVVQARPMPNDEAATQEAFFAGRGYVPERMFNALHGSQRLNFAHPDGRWTIDVLLEEQVSNGSDGWVHRGQGRLSSGEASG